MAQSEALGCVQANVDGVKYPEIVVYVLSYAVAKCFQRLIHHTEPLRMSSSVRKWYQVRWFKDYDTTEERKLILKLDLLIVPYVFLVSARPDNMRTEVS
jgi:hypothetical protein